MKVLGIVGKSGSGKTTLITRLLGEFIARGLNASTIKHAKESVDLDQPGKDSFLHRQAGAKEVAIITPRRWALLHELREASEPPIGEIIAVMTPIDVLLVEGLREGDYECIEVCRAGAHQPARIGHPKTIAIASNQAWLTSDAPVIDIDAPGLMCDFLLRHWSMPRPCRPIACGLEPPLVQAAVCRTERSPSTS